MGQQVEEGKTTGQKCTYPVTGTNNFVSKHEDNLKTEHRPLVDSGKRTNYLSIHTYLLTYLLTHSMEQSPS